MMISVIVPVYNGGETFLRCLQALGRTLHDQWECIVIDDGSTDGSAAMAQQCGATLLRTPQARGGPAFARNLGAQVARGEVLLFIDADVLVKPHTVGDVAAFMQSNPDVSAIFGSYDDTPTERNFLSQYRNLLHHFVHQTSRPEACTFWSGCGAIRRDVFLALGGFNTTAFPRPSIEDIELGYRLCAAGHRIRLLKSLQVGHMKRWTARQVLVTDIRDRAYPWAMLLLKSGTIPNDLNLQREQRLSAVSLFIALCGISISLLLTLFCMCLGELSPFALGVSTTSFLFLVLLNLDFYRFLHQKRGFFFLVRSLPWHWLYFVYSSLVFALCVIRSRFFGVASHGMEPHQSLSHVGQ